MSVLAPPSSVRTLATSSENVADLLLLLQARLLSLRLRRSCLHTAANLAQSSAMAKGPECIKPLVLAAWHLRGWTKRVRKHTRGWRPVAICGSGFSGGTFQGPHAG